MGGVGSAHSLPPASKAHVHQCPQKDGRVDDVNFARNYMGMLRPRTI